MAPLHFLRRNFTYANVVSLIVIACATTTGAYAATMYKGINIKDSTLTGADFKDRSIDAKDISATAKASMRGRAGAVGATGEKGGPGPQGDTGETGDMGKQAHSLVRYATFHSPWLRTNPAAIPNASAKSWDDPTYDNYGTPTLLPNFEEFFPNGDVQRPINGGEPVLLQLTGNNETTTGTIKPNSTGLLTATATLTILHEQHGETDHAGGQAVHGRMRCKLRYANNGAALNATSPTLGAGEWLSSRNKHKIYTITLTGSEKITANALTNYNVGVSCADVDRTGSEQWYYVSGNITAHAIFVGP